MTNSTNTVLYIGVTANLIKRVNEHKEKLIKGFTQRYNLTKLVYFEIFEDIEEAIKRKKQLKAGSRKKKIALITKDNPFCRDLYDKIVVV